MNGPTAGRPPEEVEMPERSWLYDHIGRIAGIALGAIFFAFVAFLAVLGFRPALFLLVLVVAFVGMIALGSQLRGGR